MREAEFLQQLQPALQLEIEVSGDADPLINLLRDQPEAPQVEPTGSFVRCRWAAPRGTPPTLHPRIVQEGIDLIALAVKTDNLEDIYMKVSGHQTA